MDKMLLKVTEMPDILLMPISSKEHLGILHASIIPWTRSSHFAYKGIYFWYHSNAQLYASSFWPTTILRN